MVSIDADSGWPSATYPSESGATYDAKGIMESVQATMNYQSPSVERTIVRNGKIKSVRDAQGSDRMEGAQWCPEQVSVRNGRLASLSLDGQGFELRKSPTALSYEDFYNQEATISAYYRECAEIIKAATGASIVEAFDHNVRSVSGKVSNTQVKGGSAVQGPATLVHGDYTITSGPDRLEQLGQPPRQNDTLRKSLGGKPLLSKEAIAKAKNGRFAIVNLWRNIRPDPVQVLPLACCDAQTVTADQDLCVYEIHYSDRIGENYFAAPSANHQWYYYPQMVRDEALLLKTWDSAGTMVGGSKATFCLHSAFVDPTTRSDAQDRESIEVRCIVIYENGEKTPPALSKL